MVGIGLTLFFAGVERLYMRGSRLESAAVSVISRLRFRGGGEISPILYDMKAVLCETRGQIPLSREQYCRIACGESSTKSKVRVSLSISASHRQALSVDDPAFCESQLGIVQSALDAGGHETRFQPCIMNQMMVILVE
jgi:hypothetical protein